MTPKQLILSQLAASHFLYEKFAEGFSNEEAKFVPCKGGNHLNWILCHIAVSEDGIISKITGDDLKISKDLHERYNGKSTCTPDDGMTKAEAWKLYTETRTRTTAFIESFPEIKYDEKAPEGFPPMFPNVGSVVGLISTHPFWHLGQITVNHKALGKAKVLG